MTAQRLWVPGQLPGLNELLKLKRRQRDHGQDAYGLEKRRWTDRIGQQLLIQRIRPVGHCVRVAFEWHEANAARDPDNIAGGGQKVLLDALVLHRILPDDSQAWIRGLEHRWVVERTNPGVWVTLAELHVADEPEAPPQRQALPRGHERLVGRGARVARVW